MWSRRKFQILLYVITDQNKIGKISNKNKVKEKNQFDMLKNLELSEEDLKNIFILKKKIEFLSTPERLSRCKFFK